MSVIKEILTLYVERADWFAELLLGHIALALTAIVLSGTIGLLRSQTSFMINPVMINDNLYLR